MTKDLLTVWEGVYDEKTQRSPNIVKKNYEYWEQTADELSVNWIKKDYDYRGKVLEVLKELITPRSEVVDIGAGPGTIAIPVSREVQKVLAIEQAPRMAACLRKNAKTMGIRNVTVIVERWEHVDHKKLKGMFDLTVASRVIQFFRDIWDQINRMELISRGYCCVIVPVTGSSDPKTITDKALWTKILGCRKWLSCPYQPYHEIFYNILKAQDREPNKKMIQYHETCLVDEQVTRYELLYSKYTQMTNSVKRIIGEHISKDCHDGIYTTRHKANVIWWTSQ